MSAKEENLKSNTMASILEEYYSDNKNLNAQKIQKVPGKLEENKKEELFKLARKNDFDLEKTKKLLIFIEELTGLNLHQEQLFDFISGVVMKHDVMVSHEKKDWFQNKEIPQNVFNRLFGKKELGNKELPLAKKNIIGSSKKPSVIEATIKNARVNALNIALLWKYRKRILTFNEFLGQLQKNTYTAHNTIQKNKITLELSQAETEKKEASDIIDAATLKLREYSDAKNNLSNEIPTDTAKTLKEEKPKTNKINKSSLKSKSEIKKLEEIEREKQRQAKENLEKVEVKIKNIKGRLKNTDISINKALGEKIIPFILSSKQDDINNISNLMEFYYEQNKIDKESFSEQYEINSKLGTSIENLNKEIQSHQASFQQLKAKNNALNSEITKLKEELANIEQSKIETGISARDKENVMKGDLNSMLSKEIPKIETAISAIEMGKIPFVKQFLQRLLEQFQSKLNDSLKGD